MAHKLITAVAILLAVAATADASAWPTESAAVPSLPIFPVDQIQIRAQVDHLEEQLEQAQGEQAKFVTAMNGLLNAVESLQSRLAAAEAQEAERRKAEEAARVEAEKIAKAAAAQTQQAAQASGQWVWQDYCTTGLLGLKTCKRQMVWVAKGN